MLGFSVAANPTPAPFKKHMTAYADGSFRTPRPSAYPVIEYPFANAPTPDPYARLTRRSARQSAAAYTPATAARYSWTNRLLYSNDLTNAAWSKTATGTGTTPTVTAGFTGPNGGPAFRLQCNRGVGGTDGNLSWVAQALASQPLPRSSASGVWLKSNTGASQAVYLSSGDGQGARVVTTTTAWQFFSTVVSVDVGTSESFIVGTRGSYGSDQTLDILVAAPQYDAAGEVGPYIATGATAASIESPAIDGQAERQIWTNRLLYSTDLTNAAWSKTATGTGTTPTVTAGFTGPNGGPAFRLQCNRGAGGTDGNLSWVAQALARQPLPRSSASGVWLKSNTGASQAVYLSSGGGQGVRVVTATTAWQFFSTVVSVAAGTSESFIVGTRGSYGSAQTLDILVAAPQYDVAATVGPYIATGAAAASIALDSTPILHRDWFAYLLTEELSPPDLADDCTVTRTFGRIPSPQIEYSTIALNKPAFPTADFEGYWVDNTTSEGLVNIWGLAEPLGTVSITPYGGTFTLTYKTSTTSALAYNAADATIEAALNALADAVSDGLTFTVDNSMPTDGRIRVERASGPNFGQTDMSFSGASLTPACDTGLISNGFSSFNWRALRQTINIELTAHGLSASDPIRLSTSAGGGGTLTAVSSVFDANNFLVPRLGPFSIPTIPTHLRRPVRTYIPGPDRIRSRRTTTYYLPGVTAGVDDAEDIPVPDVALNDLVLLLLVCQNATGYQDYDAEALATWIGPIYQQTVIAIEMADL